jgi:hypothetical protein
MEPLKKEVELNQPTQPKHRIDNFDDFDLLELYCTREALLHIPLILTLSAVEECSSPCIEHSSFNTFQDVAKYIRPALHRRDGLFRC